MNCFEKNDAQRLQCLNGATLWDMSPQEMRVLDPALRLGYAYRINQHIRMFKYAIEETKNTPFS